MMKTDIQEILGKAEAQRMKHKVERMNSCLRIQPGIENVDGDLAIDIEDDDESLRSR